MGSDGVRLATYEWGEPDAPTVVAVHGFASSALLNWRDTGWTRDLVRSGFHVIAVDQRGHGGSEKPHDTVAYSMDVLVADLLAVLDAYMLDEIAVLGYSLGARVGWHAAIAAPHRISRAVLGGIPDGQPLRDFDTRAALEFVAAGTPVVDDLTRTYLDMAGGLPGNDLTALISLVEGMKSDPPIDATDPPAQPVLIATGSRDAILEGSRSLASAAPAGRFLEIPDRTHFTAPPSHHFRRAGIAFLAEGAGLTP
jgi:pimeloyl-ACP methyl ester carboxylesterase